MIWTLPSTTSKLWEDWGPSNSEPTPTSLGRREDWKECLLYPNPRVTLYTEGSSESGPPVANLLKIRARTKHPVCTALHLPSAAFTQRPRFTWTTSAARQRWVWPYDFKCTPLPDPNLNRWTERSTRTRMSVLSEETTAALLNSEPPQPWTLPRAGPWNAPPFANL